MDFWLFVKKKPREKITTFYSLSLSFPFSEKYKMFPSSLRFLFYYVPIFSISDYIILRRLSVLSIFSIFSDFAVKTKSLTKEEESLSNKVFCIRF